tara:strand:- start:230 stop:652 length:423 start_codon:yes stop_codon:yes gene_type:complete
VNEFNEFDPIADLPLFQNNKVLETAQRARRDHEAETDWERFKDLHKSRPGIYRKFCEIALTMIERGQDRDSAYSVMHVLRFQDFSPGVDMRPESDYKISNNMTPFYARLFHRDYPEHREFFSIKSITKQKFDESWINEII